MIGAAIDDIAVPLPGAFASDRRCLLQRCVALATLAMVPVGLSACGTAEQADEPTERQRQVMALVADLVIPTTDTPGAVATGVPAFIELALGHGLGGTGKTAQSTRARPAGIGLFAWLEDALDWLAGDFVAAVPARQAAVLMRLDAAGYATGNDDSPWRRIKGLILTGYYTSEIGASRELRYELVPGRYDPDIALLPDDRSWSSDWIALDFG